MRKPISTLSRLGCGLILALACLAPLSAQTPPRFALVIGNSAYQGLPPLKNPSNDAADVAAALRGIGFDVTLAVNANKKGMEDGLRGLKQKLATDARAEGIFYYAGHGVQSEGVNYLVPVDAVIAGEEELPYQAVNANMALDLMKSSGNAVNMVILDACRDNPFAWSRSATRGLTVVGKQPSGSIIVFATAAGNTAADGNGRNGVFTQGLLKHLTTPGIDIQEMLKRTGAEVQKLSAGVQNPAIYSQFFGNWMLAGAAAPPQPVPGGTVAPTVAPGAAPSFGQVVAATGNLTITLAYAGKVTVGGATADIPAGTVPVNNLAAGNQAVTVVYPDGKTETATVYINAGKTAAVSFSYQPPAKPAAPAPAAPAPAAAPAAPIAAKPAAAAAPAGPVPTGVTVSPDGGHNIRGEVYVAGGGFQMGTATGGYADESPAHKVTLAPFWMMPTEVTQKDYQAVVGSNPAGFKGDRLPVETVSWLDAVAYANALSAKDGLRPAYKISGTAVSCDWTANGWRLPTEAEWEYAARGGQLSKGYAYAGGNDAGQVAWIADNSGGATHEVATKYPNELGIYDLSGNVREWCWDWKGDYSAAAQTNPRGPDKGDSRIVRGGRFSFDASISLVGYRYGNAPTDKSNSVGFRLVRMAGKSAPVDAAAQAAPAAAPAAAPVAAAPVAAAAAPGKDIRGELFVAGGSYQMGTVNGGSGDEKPVHQVTLAAFWMMSTEVTQQLYADLMGKNPASHQGNRFPVEMVSWYDAVAFANKLSAKDGLKAAYTISGANVSCDWSANGWRLPTEAEWEYAAEGGVKSRGTDYAGSADANAVSWNSDNSGGTTHQVASKNPNELGIYDLSGNVWEWCWDWYGDYSASAQTNPRGPANGTERVRRGGSWYNSASGVTTGFRFGSDPAGGQDHVGFRLVRAGK
jgi:formylglycine-generating enzyme required for sulfatase activity